MQILGPIPKIDTPICCSFFCLLSSSSLLHLFNWVEHLGIFKDGGVLTHSRITKKDHCLKADTKVIIFSNICNFA